MQVIAAMAVFLLGSGITALGLVDSDLWVIGLLMASIGGIGILVRLADWARVLRE